MNSAPRLLVRSLVMLAVLTAALVAPGDCPSPTPPPDNQPADEALAGIRPEGRLRKLHLVRPDLIPYPIAYEVYC